MIAQNDRGWVSSWLVVARRRGPIAMHVVRRPRGGPGGLVDDHVGGGVNNVQVGRNCGLTIRAAFGSLTTTIRMCLIRARDPP
jgi:hypothetical protein